MLLTHVYLCKWKYRDLNEFKKDRELTQFIIQRIERKIVQQWVAKYVCDQPEIDPSMLGKFVTAKLKYHEGCRQGWIITCGYPYLIKGQSGNVYVCVGKPAVVTNPPKREN